MLRSLRRPLLITLLILLLAAVGYWNILPGRFLETPPAPSTDRSIDNYVINARSRQFQPDGSLRYEMRADRLDHVAASDVTLMDKPRLEFYRADQPPTHAESDRGEVSPGGEQVEMIDNVKVERQDSKAKPMILTTSRMTVWPQKDYAQTDQAVRIQAANGVTTATGMKAYLNDSKVELLSKVRGQHAVR